MGATCCDRKQGASPSCGIVATEPSPLCGIVATAPSPSCGIVATEPRRRAEWPCSPPPALRTGMSMRITVRQVTGKKCRNVDGRATVATSATLPCNARRRGRRRHGRDLKPATYPLPSTSLHFYTSLNLNASLNRLSRSWRIHLIKHRRNRLAELHGETLSDLVEVVAGKAIEPHDGLCILALDSARHKSRVVFRAYVWSYPAQRLLHSGSLPFPLGKVLVCVGRRSLRLLPERSLEIRIALAGLQPVHDAPVYESREV